MSLPPSGRSCSASGRSASPSATTDLLSLLDVNNREDEDACPKDVILAFTLLNALSTVSSLGPGLSTPVTTADVAEWLDRCLK